MTMVQRKELKKRWRFRVVIAESRSFLGYAMVCIYTGSGRIASEARYREVREVTQGSTKNIMTARVKV